MLKDILEVIVEIVVNIWQHIVGSVAPDRLTLVIAAPGVFIMLLIALAAYLSGVSKNSRLARICIYFLCIAASCLFMVMPTIYPNPDAAKIIELQQEKARLTESNKYSALTLQYFFYDGTGEEQYFSELEKFLHEYADKGYPEAQFWLGYMLDPNHAEIKRKHASLMQDNSRSRELYYKAALQSHINAQYFLGHSYYAEMNYPSAAAWYKLAADQGSEDAQRALGYMYGIGYAFGEVPFKMYGASFTEGFANGQADR